MSKRGASIVLATAMLMSMAAGGAWAAEPASKSVDFTVRAEPTTVAPSASRAYKLDASKGRFGLTFGMQQPDGRPATPNDVSAGAFFRITPSVRVGGSVALGDQDLTPQRNQARPADQPKVRLESSFKF
ncbi:NtrZ family periplasmic regulatory protein [Phenylobacterium sp.]|uniref:NtrZ family periplasmic regulatory protein n=1 Tax=Phenylobacterium sp. TaxID=1871053 RepID=UPI00301CFA9E